VCCDPHTSANTPKILIPAKTVMIVVTDVKYTHAHNPLLLQIYDIRATVTELSKETVNRKIDFNSQNNS
jgi:hypothetical protein